jgi:hypothetical protein
MPEDRGCVVTRAPVFDAMSRYDMRMLATQVMCAPTDARPALAARMLAERIILPSQWWVRFAVWLAKKRHRTDDYGAWAHLLTKAPKLAGDFIQIAADWIVAGKEADGKGVGGLHQGEVDKLTIMLTEISRNYHGYASSQEAAQDDADKLEQQSW